MRALRMLLGLFLAGCASSGVHTPRLPQQVLELHPGLSELPGAADVLPPDDPSRMWVYAQPSDAAVASTVDVPSMPFRTARRVSTRRVLPQPWQVQLAGSNTAALRKGDVLLAAFWARATGPKPDGQLPTLWASMRETASSWRTIAAVYRPLSTAWQEVLLPCRIDADYAPNGLALTFLLGGEEQEMEVGGVVVLDFGAALDLARLPATGSTYGGREPEAPWRAAAADRIERIRKGDLRVVVVGPDGQPVPGVNVGVRLQKHSFWFGTAVSSRILARTEEGERYRAWTKRLFNKVTVENEMKWSPWEGDPRYPDARRKAIEVWNWARSNGLAMRGHTLVWGSPEFLPADVSGLGPDALRARIDAHIRDEMSVFAGGIVEWDVHSEPITAPGLTNVLGWDAAARWYQLAEELDPGARMYTNEVGALENPADAQLEAFLDYVRGMRELGAPVEGISPQSHFFGGPLLSPEALLRKLDRLAELGLEIQPDQFEVVLSDPACQADYLRDYYTVAFSHPSVVGVVAWGYWQSDMWMPPAALLRSDGSLTPSGLAYQDLVLGKWWTRDDAVTGADGAVTVRGFLGEYRVTAELPGRHAETTVVLPRGGSEVRLELPPG